MTGQDREISVVRCRRLNLLTCLCSSLPTKPAPSHQAEEQMTGKLGGGHCCQLQVPDIAHLLVLRAWDCSLLSQLVCMT